MELEEITHQNGDKVLICFEDIESGTGVRLLVNMKCVQEIAEFANEHEYETTKDALL